jgi:hypothetical protein
MPQEGRVTERWEQGMADAEQAKLAAEAYIYGYPLVYDLREAASFVDAWTDNFAYIGRRATGTAEAQYLLTDRDYDGPVPDAMTAVAAPTGVFTIVGRMQLNGEADLPAVHDLQSDSPGPGRGLPPDHAHVPAPTAGPGRNLCPARDREGRLEGHLPDLGADRRPAGLQPRR